MDYLVVKTAFELLSYLKSCIESNETHKRELNNLKLLYSILNDFITTNLEKEKGEVNRVTRPKE